MIEDYTNNKHAVMGMLSKHYIPFSDYTGFYKNKKKDKIVVFNNPNYSNNKAKEINHYYNFDKPENKKYSSSTLLVSKIDSSFFELKNRRRKEIRECRNYWNKKIIIKNDINNIDDVIELINKWEEHSGKKYRWNRHSGYDKAFFIKYYEQEKKDLYSLFFYYDNILVGYSIISKLQEDDNCYRYVIRKADISIGRNINLYIDYKSFENIYLNNNGEFFINWGASSGNVLKYKRKFPIYKEKKVYFYKEKNDLLK